MYVGEVNSPGSHLGFPTSRGMADDRRLVQAHDN